ncbi:Uncharacterised protein [Vibrio cholerae]|nr:Uncharacterised protein [Vibrio cholerae]CSC92010.1 Uncharacterised protein [Vibrio cholerae]
MNLIIEIILSYSFIFIEHESHFCHLNMINLCQLFLLCRSHHERSSIQDD